MTLKVITTQSGTTCKLTSIPRTRHQSTVSESSKPAPFVLPLTTFSVLSLSSSSSGHRSARNGRVTAVRAMPTPSSAGSVCRFDDSTFLASLMPKKETGVDRFLEAHPEYDGRGVIVAIFDSGVDPAVAGLQVTSDGKPKILDIVDCTGSGDIDTSEIVKADADGQIIGKSGIPLIVNPSWKNPSGEWHIGCKLVYELFTNTLTERLKKEKRKKWDEKNQEAISDALRNLDAFIKMHGKPEDIILKKAKEDLQNKIDILRKQAENYDDRGPIIDVVVWNDGSLWRVAVDTQSLEDDSKSGMLADFVPLTNYRIERKYGVFSKLDACSFVTNVYNDGNLLSLVTDCSPHGTHVAGITAAFHPEEPLLNGVAPGAQLISCKIGDSRLGSMETGTGLVRALIVAVEHKCDLINMSYGEATLLPDYGRFVDLVNEVVDKHRLIFISSAGNNGPALSTVGSPGGTSSSIIGVGAYVSPAMAAGPHCTVEAPPEGLEYTWSSRGPTLDGDLGVCISAPGGAVSPVPTWTLQRRMLMNGTSMSSPSACGGVAIIISGMKAEGVSISPYVVRKALENTAISVGINPEDKLSIGQGLMQVDSAFEYLLQGRNLPCVCYKVSVNRSGKSSPLSRGIYLREPNSCKQSTEWTIQVDPKFHEDASNLEELVPFEEHIKLHSSDKSVIKVPEYLLLTHNGRSFNIVVDPSNLNMGLHYYEVYGVDCKAPWRGPLFRVPITLIKPDVPKGQPPLLSFSGISFVPGKIERKFIEVPDGATWAEATMKTSCFDTPRRFFLDAVQTCPLMRTMKWETVVTFTTPSLQCFSFPVRGGLTLELVLSQFWSSGLGSNEATFVDFEVVFHGININREELVFDGSEAPLRIDAKSLLCSETLFPVASLNKVKIPHRPVDSKLSSLLADRDKLPSGRQVISLTLTYKFKLDEGAEIKPCIPLLNNRVYDIKFESQFYMISDSDKRVYATGDAYPKYVKLPKGEYTLQLLIRHDNVTFLDKVKQLLVFIERKLDKKDIIQLPFFTQPDGPIVGNCAFKSSLLVPGELEAFYVGPPTKDKIPKNCPSGAILIGTISYGKLSLVSKKDEKNQQPPTQYKISYIIPPSMVNDTGKENSSNKMEISERLEEEVRAAKLKILATLKHATAEERESWKEFCSTLKSEYPRYTPLLAKILEGWVSGTVGDVTNNHKKEVVAAANDVIKSINKDELSNYFSTRHDPDDDEFESMKKEMELTRDQLVEALYQKGIALAEMQSPNVEIPTEGNIAERKVYEETIEGYIPVDSDQSDTFEETLKELKRWVDLKSSKFAMLLVKNEIRDGRLGTALKVLDDIIQDESNSSKKKLYELKIKLLKEIGWDHVASYERQWMHIRFPSILSSL